MVSLNPQMKDYKTDLFSFNWFLTDLSHRLLFWPICFSFSLFKKYWFELSVLTHYCLSRSTSLFSLFIHRISLIFLPDCRLGTINVFHYTWLWTAFLNEFYYQLTVLSLEPRFLSIRNAQPLVEIRKICLITADRFAYQGFCWYYKMIP